ncbi:MAG: SH3 domain-containing protein [Ardenticatenaceae bacterium]|nr:SH3 domain-containing protein [Ardenticatenaceae bacterium]
MAQYKIPPDPRDRGKKNNEKRLASGEKPFSEKEPVPWLWLGGGIIITLIGLGLSILLLRSFLLREPLAVTPVEPTIIVLTAPPSPTWTPLAEVVLPTVQPTFTPVPTPDVAVAPETITVGYYAQVVNTENVGVTVRGGPSTSNAPLTVANEGVVLLVLDGPVEANDFLWWEVRLPDGTEGWVAGDFIEPVAAPQ